MIGWGFRGIYVVGFQPRSGVSKLRCLGKMADLHENNILLNTRFNRWGGGNVSKIIRAFLLAQRCKQQKYRYNWVGQKT